MYTDILVFPSHLDEYDIIKYKFFCIIYFIKTLIPSRKFTAFQVNSNKKINWIFYKVHCKKGGGKPFTTLTKCV